MLRSDGTMVDVGLNPRTRWDGHQAPGTRHPTLTLRGSATMEYDDIIVGAGSSGAVLAARLSEDPDRTVLLLEAGPDYASQQETPSDLLDSRLLSLVDHDWQLTAEAVPGRIIPYPRGKVTGGSSAVNGSVALRGAPEDYDEWAELGNEGWGWEQVLPYFRRLEDDRD